jgi:Fe-S oxidoreductase
VTVLSLGNVAERVAEVSGQNIYACYQCGKCTAGCPFGFSPQRVVRHLQLGQLEEAAALDSTWSCASCFTCVAACPKGVDPSRIMRAVRTLSGGGHHHRARSWLIANNHRLARLGSRSAPLSNWLLKAPGAGLVSQALLGVHRKRSLPPFARQTFPEWFAAHEPAGDGHRGRILLFHDTFMDFNVPEFGVAATELLEKAGFRVELTDSVCCGRPMISKGYYEQAAAQARTNVARLTEQLADGEWIVGCESSCLVTIRDEYPELVDDPGLQARAKALAARALLIDELLLMLHEQGELELEFSPSENGGKPAVFHAHCHQKAYGTPAASLALLRLAGYDARLVNTGCCGMAGSFGYEAEHYALSRAAGERELFPAVRGAGDAEVVVTGVSCRQQIEHFTARRPKHLVQVLRQALK